jgi:hypothetical protein
VFSLATCILGHVSFSISWFHLDRGLRVCNVLDITYVEVSSVACYCNLFISVARSNSFFQFMVLRRVICTMAQQPRPPSGPGPPQYRGFTITLRLSTLGRTPLDEWSARRRDLYATKHNTHNRQKSMPQVGFEPTISAGERPQTHALDRATTRVWEIVNGTWPRDHLILKWQEMIDFRQKYSENCKYNWLTD